MRSEMNCIKAFRMHGDNNPSHIGHRILLPASFIGSPRDMIQQYQDAMALLRAGKPDLFITMTCNPNWMEIQAGQKAQDQPDITETGSSYAYILVILHPEDKSQTPDGYDDIVCAEIPDPVINPRVHATIIDSMFHGPCGMLNPNAPCMVDDGIGHKNVTRDTLNNSRVNPSKGRTIILGNKSNKSWKKHQCGGCIGRMYMAHPGEVMGARSFEELRVVDGIACAIFKESAQHRVFGDVSDVHQLWIENFDAMVEDFAHNEIPEEKQLADKDKAIKENEIMEVFRKKRALALECEELSKQNQEYKEKIKVLETEQANLETEVEKLEERVEIIPTLLFDVNTIEGLSNHVYEAIVAKQKSQIKSLSSSPTTATFDIDRLELEKYASEVLVPLAPKNIINKHNNPLFCIHALLGNVACYMHFAKNVGMTRPVYGIQVSTKDIDDTDTDISSMVEKYVKVITYSQPKGPYHICGYSFGGLVAWEIAKQLINQGKKVGGVYLIDAPAPLKKLVRPTVNAKEVTKNNEMWEKDIEQLLKDVDLNNNNDDDIDDAQTKELKQTISKLIALMYNYTDDISSNNINIPVHYWRAREYDGKTNSLLLDHPEFHSTYFGWENYNKNDNNKNITFHEPLPGHHFSIMKVDNSGRLAREMDKIIPTIKRRTGSLDLKPLMLEKLANARRLSSDDVESNYGSSGGMDEEYILRLSQWILIIYSTIIILIAIGFLSHKIIIRKQAFFLPPTKGRGIIRPIPHDVVHVLTIVFNLFLLIHTLILLNDAYPNTVSAEIGSDLSKELGIGLAMIYPISIIYSTPVLGLEKKGILSCKPNKILIDALGFLLLIAPLTTLLPLAALTGHYADQNDLEMAMMFHRSHYFIWVVWGLVLLILIALSWFKLTSTVLKNIKESRKKEINGYISDVQCTSSTPKKAARNLGVAIVLLIAILLTYLAILLSYSLSRKSNTQFNPTINLFFMFAFNFTLPFTLNMTQFVFIFSTLRGYPFTHSTDLSHELNISNNNKGNDESIVIQSARSSLSKQSNDKDDDGNDEGEYTQENYNSKSKRSITSLKNKLSSGQLVNSKNNNIILGPPISRPLNTMRSFSKLNNRSSLLHNFDKSHPRPSYPHNNSSNNKYSYHYHHHGKFHSENNDVSPTFNQYNAFNDNNERIQSVKNNDDNNIRENESFEKASDLIRKESLSSSLKDVEKAKASWDRNINNNNSDDDDNDDVNISSKVIIPLPSNSIDDDDDKNEWLKKKPMSNLNKKRTMSRISLRHSHQILVNPEKINLKQPKLADVFEKTKEHPQHKMNELHLVVAEWDINISCNSKVKTIDRSLKRKNSGPILVTVENTIYGSEQTFAFDHLIIATNPKQTTKFLDVSLEETDIFSEIITYDFYTTIATVEGISTKVGMTTIPKHCTNNSQIGHVTAFYCAHEGVPTYLFYAYGKQGIASDDIIGYLKDDIEKIGGKLNKIHYHKKWDFFPHVSSLSMARGFYSKVERLQGTDETFYVGGWLDFELTENCVSYSKDLVKRFFNLSFSQNPEQISSHLPIRQQITLKPVSQANWGMVLRLAANRYPKKVAYTWVDVNLREEAKFTYGQLYQQARAVAYYLRNVAECKVGDPILLCYAPGLSFLPVLLGSMLAGTIAVPIAPPDLEKDIERFIYLANITKAKYVFSDKNYMLYTKIHSVKNFFGFGKKITWPESLIWLEGEKIIASFNKINVWINKTNLNRKNVKLEHEQHHVV
ncbi:15617_t:CDS:10 [Entrophospora sp. SA101]|nr:15617_t:CDS:10 [Entrophospora sp. SA101]